MASAETSETRKKNRTADGNTQRQKHRLSHMELSKSDMLQLLSNLETELQARDRVIASLKAEKAKQFLYQAKYGRFSLSDPLYAMQRDSDFEGGPTSKSSKYDDPMTQLDRLIEKQHEAENQMKEQLHVIDRRYQKVCTELEDEKWEHNHDLEQGDSVVLMLEKDRERLRHEVHVERSQNKNLEAEVQLASEELKKFAKHREVVVKLLTKRSRIVKDIDDTQCSITVLEETLRKAEDESRCVEGCVANERSKHSHIESDAEQQFGVAAKEHEQLLSRLSSIELQNRELDVELDRLRSSIGPRCRNNPTAHGSRSVTLSQNLTLLSDGVAAMNDTGTASQMRHASNVPTDMRMHGSLEAGDIRLLPSKITFDSSRAVACSKKGSDQALESSSTSRHSHHVVPARPSSDIQTIPHVDSANSTAAPTMVSVTTNSGLRVSVAVSGPSSQVRKQVPPTGVPGRGAPPPVPPNKPQVFITHPPLPALSAGGGVSRVAQPSRPQTQTRYGAAFPQDRTTVPDSRTLTSAAPTGLRQTPAPPTSAGTSSHLAMVVGDTSAVHKHPSQVCVNIK